MKNLFKIEEWLYNKIWSKDGSNSYEIIGINQNNGNLQMQNICDLTDHFEISFETLANEYLGK